MIQLDYKDRRPLYEQVTERFQELILNGVLKPDEKIPSVRSMAMELSVTPNTIQRAYSELEKSGYVYTVTGRGNFVASAQALHALHREKIIFSLKTAVMKAKSSGISRMDVLEVVELIYGGVTHDTN